MIFTTHPEVFLILSYLDQIIRQDQNVGRSRQDCRVKDGNLRYINSLMSFVTRVLAISEHLCSRRKNHNGYTSVTSLGPGTCG